ncbi:MAG TPA: TonB family protein [Noviherbaspirillum sp.]
MDLAPQRKTPTKRIGVFTLVIFLHAMVLYALATGFARKVVEVIPRPVEVRIIEEMKPMPQETPSPRPTLQPAPPKQAPKPKPRPRPFVPAPQVRRPAPSHAPSAVTNVIPPPTPPSLAPQAEQPPVASIETAPEPHVPVRTAPVVDARFCAKPEYPESSKRYEESGTVVLNFLIDADGRVIQSKIASSSGFARLDEAARQALSLCRFKPGTVDGKPEKSWHKLKYVWKLDSE